MSPWRANRKQTLRRDIHRVSIELGKTLRSDVPLMERKWLSSSLVHFVVISTCRQHKARRPGEMFCCFPLALWLRPMIAKIKKSFLDGAKIEYSFIFASHSPALPIICDIKAFRIEFLLRSHISKDFPSTHGFPF